jgi:hypothetical protein
VDMCRSDVNLVSINLCLLLFDCVDLKTFVLLLFVAYYFLCASLIRLCSYSTHLLCPYALASMCFCLCCLARISFNCMHSFTHHPFDSTDFDNRVRQEISTATD